MSLAANTKRGPSADSRADEDRLDRLAINTIRTLAVDAVQKANSGHAGTPMAMAAVAYTLWQQFLRYDPADPHWPNRDRFVLSCGHASMLLYSLLHLAGVRADDGGPAVSLDDIKQFRQLNSRTPGHPEYHLTTGVETTTGPLGQGCGNSVGMAMASRWLADRFNSPDTTLFDYDVYVLCSDGDMMEGVASEAASLAGHLKLSNLCWIYDSNTITIEGHTDLAFNENVGERFHAYGWNVLHVDNAEDRDALVRALNIFKKTDDRPTMIIVNSVIGYGAPHKQGTAAAHSDALGEEEVRLTKRAYGWPEDAFFLVPDGVRERFAEGVGKRGAELNKAWRKVRQDFAKQNAKQAEELDTLLAGKLPKGWDAALPSFKADPKGMATRESSGKVLNAIAERIPWLLGGSADLAPSNKTKLGLRRRRDAATRLARRTQSAFRRARTCDGRRLQRACGVCGLRPFGATFLVFSDYMRPAIRLAALMELPLFHIFTHDFDRRRRRRTDASAGRAASGIARNSRSFGAAPCRRKRSGRILSRHSEREKSAGVSGAEPAGIADLRS